MEPRNSHPSIDKLAEQGCRFTDAYSTTSVCTPSRYALFTGEYPWRKEGTGILPGDAALIIDTKSPPCPRCSNPTATKPT
ncbi:MAG: sulfatase-like hydrolase/transferase [Akkermansia muciniphila]